MPWLAILLLIGIIAVTVGCAALLFRDTVMAAIPGAVAGLFGALLTPRRSLPWPLVLALCGVLLLTLAPPTWAMVALLVALSAAAGAEAVLTGGRSGVLALFVVVGLHLIPAMPAPTAALAPAAFAMALAWGLAQVTPLAGSAAQPPAPPRFGIGLALFLTVGLSIATFAMRLLSEDFAHWLALLFVMRGLAAPGQVVQSALRFGIGATIGSALALVALWLALPQPVMLALALAGLLAGFRMAPDPGPWSAAGMSVAVLCLTSPSPHDALFRIEAAAFAVLLSTALVTVFAALWSALDRRQQTVSSSSRS